MPQTLRPCPFCGHDKPSFERAGTRRQSCIVVCGNCGARHESSDEGEDSGKSWNQRLDTAIRDMLTSIVSRSEAELLATPEADLGNRWHFYWDDKASPAWNLYKFSDALESLKRDCRQWETHHHGSCCVVERVRDKYLMPKIKDVLERLKS